MSDVAVVDYGMGNLHSALKAFRRLGAEPEVVAAPGGVASARRLVLPGVGHFGRAMANLEASGLRGALDEAVLGRGVPLLGICLGMQLLARHSEEGDAAGLGWIDADVVRFRVSDPLRFKVPQMGWNAMRPTRESPLTRGLPDDAEFYFVHAYHLRCPDPAPVLGETVYDYPFASAVGRDNVLGVQFHPEKSHDAGARLLANFLAL
ncbi:MAG: imidazole glycerol phosphate synthase subunit HisH [Gemmatimonadota bacterium]